jgi:hypothetical protein
MERYVGEKYRVRLIDKKYSFLPAFFPQKNTDVTLIKNI